MLLKRSGVVCNHVMFWIAFTEIVIVSLKKNTIIAIQ